jgi:hypothetical protein
MVQRDGSRAAAAPGDHRLKLLDRRLPWNTIGSTVHNARLNATHCEKPQPFH